MVGLTLVELMLALAVVGVLGAIAHAGYTQVVEKARVKEAMADIAELSAIIERYRTEHGTLPPALTAAVPAGRSDPWGNQYHYTRLEGVQGNGGARKDRRLNPLNSDYDLFSAGRNGIFRTQITQKDSLDDVIRASTGSYIGLAEDF